MLYTGINAVASKSSLCLFLEVPEDLLRIFLLFALEQAGSKDDGQIIGTHFVDVFMLCKSVGKGTENSKKEQTQESLVRHYI